MNMKTVVQSARLYARSEAMVAEIRLRVLARKLAFTLLGILAGVMGLAFINLAAFLYLQSFLGPVWTPLSIGLANFLIAGIALAVALLSHGGADLDLAKDLRSVSSKALEEELQAPSSLGGLAGPGPSFVRLLLPVITLIVSSLTQRKTTAKK